MKTIRDALKISLSDPPPPFPQEISYEVSILDEQGNELMSRSHTESSTSYHKIRVASGRTSPYTTSGDTPILHLWAKEFLLLPRLDFTLPPISFYSPVPGENKRWRKNLNLGTNQEERAFDSPLSKWVVCEYERLASGSLIVVNYRPILS